MKCRLKLPLQQHYTGTIKHNKGTNVLQITPVCMDALVLKFVMYYSGGLLKHGYPTITSAVCGFAICPLWCSDYK